MHTGSENAGWLMSVDMASLAETRVFDLYDGTVTSLHISGKAFNKPGWVAVSAYNCKEAGGWACDKVRCFLLFCCPLNSAFLVPMDVSFATAKGK